MKKIALLVPKGEVMPASVVSAYLLFTQINQFLEESGQAPAFEVEILGYGKRTLLYDGAFAVHAHRHFRHAGAFDIIIVPGFICDMELPLRENAPMIAWMKKKYEQEGAELASMCTGAFLIAATGLLDGRRCTTHWAFEPAFRRCFPRVLLQPDRIVTDDGGIYASGGAYSSLNLILYLVEKFCGKEYALWASKVFQIDLDRQSQKRFAIFQQQKNHTDQPVTEVQAYIEQHYQQPLTVQGLAAHFAFSRRNFIRRFKEATGNTPIEYIQRVRIEAAKRMLEGTSIPVSAIMAETGYSDSKTFRTIFKKYTGYSPSVYKGRYNRLAQVK